MNCPNGLILALVAFTPARILASGITIFINCGSAAKASVPDNIVPDNKKLNRTAVCRIKCLLSHDNAAAGHQVHVFLPGSTLFIDAEIVEKSDSASSGPKSGLPWAVQRVVCRFEQLAIPEQHPKALPPEDHFRHVPLA